MPRSSFGHIDRRSNNGKFRARYIGPDGKSYSADNGFGRSQTFETWRQAETWLASNAAAMRAAGKNWRSPYAQADDRELETFAAFATRWVDERDIRPRTVDHYHSLLRNHLLPTFGSLPLGAITPPMIRTWRDVRRDKRAIKAQAYSLLSTIMATAVRDQHPGVTFNPCLVEGGGSIETIKEGYVFTNEEMDALKAALPERYRAMVDLGCWASLRIGEVLALRRRNLNLTATAVMEDGTVIQVPTVAVEAGVTHTKANGLTAGPPKTKAGVRVVTFHPTVIPRLQEHLNSFVKPDEDALLFPARMSGDLMVHSSVQRVWRPACRRVGLPDTVTFHDLRHTGQTKAAQAGATAAELGQRAGQADLKIAMLYTHSTGPRQVIVAHRME